MLKHALFFLWWTIEHRKSRDRGQTEIFVRRGPSSARVECACAERGRDLRGDNRSSRGLISYHFFLPPVEVFFSCPLIACIVYKRWEQRENKEGDHSILTPPCETTIPSVSISLWDFSPLLPPHLRECSECGPFSAFYYLWRLLYLQRR